MRVENAPGFEVVPPLGFGEPLDRVSQHRARHRGGVLVEEAPGHRLVALAHLAQHPPARLVHEIVIVSEEALTQLHRIVKLPVADQRLCGYDRDALLPQALRFREPAQHRALAPQQPGAENLRRAAVHEIPVVDPFRVREVELHEVVAPGSLKSPDENELREQAFLVPSRAQQAEHIRLAHVIALRQQRARLRHGDAEELVALAILTRPGLKTVAP